VLSRRPKPALGPKVFFATDVHGSTLTFRKILAAPRFYGADAIVIGGDLTGKRLIQTADAEQIARAETEGAYAWNSECFSSSGPQLGDPDATRRLFEHLARSRLASWLTRAEEVLAATQTPCYMIGGNDDSEELVSLLASHDGPWVRYCEDRVVPLEPDYHVVGFGWSNPTPWNTPREIQEEDIACRLRAVLAASPELGRTIVNVHVPPHGVLDVCPKLDASVSPPQPVIRGGQVVTASVGSTAIREIITQTQPLMALCGHVHESRGATQLGRTTVLNPGSEYQQGVLRGAVIQLDGDRTPRFQLTAG